jgi:hypothetical protein
MSNRAPARLDHAVPRAWIDQAGIRILRNSAVAANRDCASRGRWMGCADMRNLDRRRARLSRLWLFHKGPASRRRNRSLRAVRDTPPVQLGESKSQLHSSGQRTANRWPKTDARARLPDRPRVSPVRMNSLKLTRRNAHVRGA